MPNGYRRGGTVHRNGRTFTRRGTTIRRPLTTLVVGLVGVTALTGGASVGSPLLIAGVSVALVGYVVYRNRRRLRPLGRRLERWAGKRNTKTVRDPYNTGLGVTVSTWKKRSAQPVVRINNSNPKPRALSESGAYLDDQLRPHYPSGKFMPVREWERLYYGKDADR